MWVALITTAGGYGWSVISVPMLGFRLASFINLVEVLIAVAFAWILLSEVHTVIQAAGGALILAGVILVRADSLFPGNPPGDAAITPVMPAPGQAALLLSNLMNC